MNDKSVPTIEQRFLSATGATIREWAFLEHQLFNWLSILTTADQFRARILWFSLPNSRARFNLLRRLGETYLDDNSLPRFRSLLKRANKLAGKRNGLAHTHWTVIEGRKIRLYFDEEDESFGFNFASERTFDINNLEHFPQALTKLRNDFANLLFKAKIYTSPKIHRGQPADLPQKNDRDQKESIP
jgi:hypothetical protein